MGNQIYNPLSYTQTQPPAFGYVDAVNSSKRDFYAEQGNIQSLEAMMRGNQQAAAELERYKAQTPLLLDKEGYEAALARTKNNPGFIQSVLGGEMADSSIRQDRARMSRETLPGEIGTKNMGNMNAQLEQAGQFLNMVTQQAGPEKANELYVGVLKQLPPQVRASMPPSYDPESFKRFLEASTMSTEHRRNLGMENVRGSNRLADTRLQGDYNLAREELQQLGANQRTGAEIEGRDRVARTAAGARENMETPQRALARLRRELRADPNNEDSVSEYKMYLEDRWNQREERDPAIMLLKVRASQAKDPAAQEEAVQKYQQMRNQFFSEQGIELDAPPTGTIRKGKDGKDYRYKGGFGKSWRKQENWELVK